MTKAHGICGILGGMGPEATVDLMRRIIALTDAEDDCDHVRCIIDQNPHVPSRIKALLEGGGESPGPAMANMAANLEGAGADFLCIACNTAHNWLKEVQDAVKISVLDMPALAAAEAATIAPGDFCGILASPAVRQQCIFEPHFVKEGIKPLYPEPESQQRLLAIIRDIKAGRQKVETLGDFFEIAKEMVNSGAKVLIIACTELSALGGLNDIKVPVVDAADALARAIIHKAGARLKRAS